MNTAKKLSSLMLAASILLSSCAAGGESKDGSITITDQAGRTVTLEEPADRIVSSYYISTAILVALGCEDNLVGIEKKADTRELYKMAAPQIIDLPAVGSGKGISVEETAALNPDVVVLPLRLMDSAASFEELGIPVVIVDPETNVNFEEALDLLAQITGKTERGEELLSYYSEKMAEMTVLTAGAETPSVYFAGSSAVTRTVTGDMYQSDLAGIAGGKNVSDDLTGGEWVDISPEQLAVYNPEYIFAVNYAEYSLDTITSDAAYSEIEAVKNGRVYSFPSDIEAWDYPTPSSVLGVMWLTHILHPDLYSEEAYLTEAREFYKTYFDIEVTEANLGIS